jgi:hypothetical protein
VFCTTWFHGGIFFHIQTLTEVFKLYAFIFILFEYQHVKLKKSNHATFKISNCEDGHIPTDMLDNKANLL